MTVGGGARSWARVSRGLPPPQMPHMRMTFYFGHNLRLLFESWHITNNGGE